MSSAGFPYTARQQRWWFATHGAGGDVRTVSEYQEGARPHPLLFDSQPSNRGGVIVVKVAGDRKYSVWNRVNDTDVPHATDADESTASDMAQRLFGRQIGEDTGALIFGHRRVALSMIAAGAKPSEATLAQHPDLRGLSVAQAKSKLEREASRHLRAHRQ